MRIGETNWVDVETYLKHDDRCVVRLLGSMEQHV